MFAPKFTTPFTATLAATLCFAAATPAFAADAENNVRQKAVHYSDLDLTTQQGQKALEKRIGYAATSVCATRDLNQYMTCRSAALRNAKEPIGTAIAKAESQARYADAGARVVVGN